MHEPREVGWVLMLLFLAVTLILVHTCIALTYQQYLLMDNKGSLSKHLVTMCRLIQQVVLPMMSYAFGYIMSAKYPAGGYTFTSLLWEVTKNIMIPTVLVFLIILWPAQILFLGDKAKSIGYFWQTLPLTMQAYAFPPMLFVVMLLNYPLAKLTKASASHDTLEQALTVVLAIVLNGLFCAAVAFEKKGDGYREGLLMMVAMAIGNAMFLTVIYMLRRCYKDEDKSVTLIILIKLVGPLHALPGAFLVGYGDSAILQLLVTTYWLSSFYMGGFLDSHISEAFAEFRKEIHNSWSVAILMIVSVLLYGYCLPLN